MKVRARSSLSLSHTMRELLGIRVGQRSPEQRVDDAEHRRARADADRERQDHHRRESAIEAHRPQRRDGNPRRARCASPRSADAAAPRRFARIGDGHRQRTHARQLGVDHRVGLLRPICLAAIAARCRSSRCSAISSIASACAEGMMPSAASRSRSRAIDRSHRCLLWPWVMRVSALPPSSARRRTLPIGCAVSPALFRPSAVRR